MIYPRHFMFFPWLFRVYAHYQIGRHFEKHIICAANELQTDKPLLLVCNHTGWWDGFWVMNLNSQIWKRRFHVMMDEGNLKKNRWLNYAGAFSVSLYSLRKSLKVCRDILKNPDELLLYFPQGKFQSIYDKPLRFKRGADYLIRENAEQANIILIVNLTEYNRLKKPTLTSYCKRIEKADCTDTLEGIYNEFYNASIKYHILNIQS